MRRRHDGERHAMKDLAFFAQHTGQIAEPFQMFFPDRSKDRDVRLGDGPQRGDFTGRVGTHFDDRHLRLGGNRQQRERHADKVVQIALGGMHHERATKGGLEQFLGAGLAVRAGHRDHSAPPGAPPGGGELAKRDQRIGHDVGGHPESGRLGGIADDERGGTGITRGSEKIVRVEMLTDERDEHIASCHGSRIGGHASQWTGDPRSRSERISNALEGPIRMGMVGRDGGNRAECGAGGGESGHAVWGGRLGRTGAISAMRSFTISRSSKGYDVVPRI